MGGKFCNSTKEISKKEISGENEEKVKHNSDYIILRIHKYVYDEFFYEIDFRNQHCISPDRRYLITYSLDYIKIWDIKKILKGETDNVSRELNDLLMYFLYEHKSNQIKTNKKGQKMIFKNNKLYCVTFINNIQARIAFALKNKVEIFTLTLKDGLLVPPEITPYQSIQLFEIEINVIKFSNSGNELAVLENHEDFLHFSIYDTSKLRIRCVAPFGHKKFENRDFINLNNESSFFSSDFSDSSYVSQKSTVQIPKRRKSYISDGLEEINDDQPGGNNVGEKNNNMPTIYFSKDDLFIGLPDIYKKHKNTNILFRYDGFSGYEAKPRGPFTDNYVKTLCLTNDHKYTAIGNDLSDITIFDNRSHNIYFKLKVNWDKNVGITSLCFSEDSKYLAYGTDDGTIGLIDMLNSKGRIIKKWPYEIYFDKEEGADINKLVTEINIFDNIIIASILFDIKKMTKDFTAIIKFENDISFSPIAKSNGIPYVNVTRKKSGIKIENNNNVNNGITKTNTNNVKNENYEEVNVLTTEGNYYEEMVLTTSDGNTNRLVNTNTNSKVSDGNINRLSRLNSKQKETVKVMNNLIRINGEKNPTVKIEINNQ